METLWDGRILVVISLGAISRHHWTWRSVVGAAAAHKLANGDLHSNEDGEILPDRPQFILPSIGRWGARLAGNGRRSHPFLRHVSVKDG
jgi:hypothetical protein